MKKLFDILFISIFFATVVIYVAVSSAGDTSDIMIKSETKKLTK